MTISTQSNTRRKRMEACDQRLLPGIPDDVTLSQIAPKLLWRDFQELLNVSRVWRNAIQSRRVYDVRVLSNSTETFVLIGYMPSKTSRQIVLYSMTENLCYDLPSIPQLGGTGRIPPRSQCVSVDGKLYVLGGDLHRARDGSCSDEVYMLDLAAQRRWKPCAGMIQPRGNFGCGVADGKIYVFGGSCSSHVNDGLRGSEVYDPKDDTWSLIKDMASMRFDPRAATVGAETFVRCGRRRAFCAPFSPWYLAHLEKCCRSEEAVSFGANYAMKHDHEEPGSIEVYNSVKDKWGVIEGNDLYLDIFFMARGEVYLIEDEGGHICVYNFDENFWEVVHSSELDASRLLGSEHVGRSALAIGNQLLAIVECGPDYVLRDGRASGAYLFRAGGFGSTEEEIEWKQTPFSHRFEGENSKFTNYFMHPIQL